MKSVLRILIVLMLIVGVLMLVTIASAKTARIDFTGSEWCDPDTFTLIREWMAGPNYQAKGLTEICYDTADIPQMTGTDYLYDGRISFVGNSDNFILSGKLRMETDEGGVWMGSWTLPANSNTIKVVGHGEGIYEGLQLHWFLDLDGPFYGYIIDQGH
jgi:hypothetical protein